MDRELKLKIDVIFDSIKQAEKAVKNLEGTMEKSMGSASKATQTANKAQQQYTQQTQKTTKAARTAAQGQQAFTGQMQNLTKSVQVALGPLSGVAARITALTALFNRNAASIAGVIAGFTGFTVAMSQAIRRGQEFQREMLGIQSVIETTGRASVISAEEINELARSIGRETLTSANLARQALTQLTTFRNVSVEAFEEATLAAQGMSVAMGGSMQSNIRRIGRLLNEPTRNMESLARQGVEFNRVEQEKIEILERSGRLHEAQAMILERMSSFTRLASQEATGLAGAFDDLSERINQVFEESAATSTLIEKLTEVVNNFTDQLVEFLENDEAVERMGEVFSKTAQAIGNSLLFLIEHMDKLAALIAGQVVASITRLLIPAVGALGVAFRQLTTTTLATTVAIQGKTTAMGVATTAARGLAVAIRGVMAALGPLGAGIAAVSLAYMWLTRDTDESVSSADRAVKQAEEEKKTREELAEAIENETNSRIRNNKMILLEQQDKLAALREEKAELQSRREELREDVSWFNRLNLSYNESAKEQSKLKTQIIDVNQVISEQRDRVEQLEEGVRNVTTTLKNQEKQREQLEESIIGMVKAYDEEAAAAMKAEREVSALESMMDQIISMDPTEVVILAQSLGLIGEESEDSFEAVGALLDRLEGLRQEAANTDSETRDMSRQIDRARQSFQTLEDQVRATKREMAGDPLGFDMADVRRLEELNLSELGQIMDVSEARSEAEARRMIATAMQEQRNELERLQSVQQMMADPLEGMGMEDSFRSQMDDVVSLYEDQRQRFLEVDTEASREALRVLEDRFAREKDMIRQEHAEIANIEQELQQMRREQMDPAEAVRNEFAQRRMAILEAYEGELWMAQEHFENLEELERMHYERVQELVDQERQDIFDAQMGQHQQLIENFQNMMDMWGSGIDGTISSMENAFGMMSDIAGSALGESHALYKRFAQAQAIMAGALAVTKAMADPGGYAGLALAGVIGVKTGIQVAAIESQNFATGGAVRGSGTSTSDSIPAMLSNGEFVINSQAASRLGMGTLNALNQGEMPMFARGGSVGNVGSSSPSVQIINESRATIETEETTDYQGNKQLRAYIKESTDANFDTGAHDRRMGQNFGVGRRPIRR